ncbi:NADPH-dependent FMN reductase [Alphaproteobacteria bacterium GH1-50]|uniref:NADPH-dependent FMN reductase n=1 Tax=Kangsaoukella pontilimi TaxID=2691042 RepID=A0A7C9MYW7_9RHOB|nr:NAD(P)H-dependent oxidoreductase [Kangsaoukella pontilimi]MXQ09494.1 NADPH-dependent FMN reductase [Kangsaoukella pontilimi]
MGLLLGLSGSLREGSTNTGLVREIARHWGGDFELADIRFPLFDADLQDRDGVPAEVQALAQRIAEADAVVISTPEYNQSLSGVLKNALDWISRTPTKPWADKPVAITAAAAGRSGGARASYALRLAMTPFNPRLLTREILLADARNQFDEDGRLISERYEAQVVTLVEALRDEVARSA